MARLIIVNGQIYEETGERVVVFGGGLFEASVAASGSPVEVTPGAGSITIAGYAPDVVSSGNTVIEPGAGSITVTGYSPTVSVSGDSITLADIDDNRVFQRSTSGTKSITISGTYSGTPTSIEARIVQDGTDTEVHTWATLDASPSGGVFSGSITVDEGGWYNVDVRYADRPAISSSGSSAFSVGILVGVTGQSNAENWFTDGTDETPTGDTVKYNGSWALMGALGNGANTFGDTLSAAQGVPVGLLDYGEGGSALLSANSGGEYWLDATPGQVYDLFLAGVAAVGGELEYIVFGQGERDARIGNSTEAEYEAGLTTLIGNFRSDVTNASAETNLPIIISLLGRNEDTSTDADTQAVRNAQIDVCNALADCYRVTAFDLPLTDGIHYTDAAYSTYGTRHAQVILDILGDQTYHRGPIIASAAVASSTTIDVTITHSGGSDFTPTSAITGFEVTDDDWSTTKTISSAVRQDATTIRLTLTTSLSGEVKARHAYGKNPSVTGVIVDNTVLALPLEHDREFIAVSSAYASPGVGSVSIAGYAPAITTGGNIAVEPAAGSITLTGYAPTMLVGDALVVEPGVGSVVFAGFAPGVLASNDQIFYPPAGVVSFTGYVPEFSQATPILGGLAGTLTAYPIMGGRVYLVK